MTRTDLDVMLDDWARRQQLSPAEAHTIRRAVIAEPGGDPLPPTWWCDFSLRMSEKIVRAAQVRVPAVGSFAW